MLLVLLLALLSLSSCSQLSLGDNPHYYNPPQNSLQKNSSNERGQEPQYENNRVWTTDQPPSFEEITHAVKNDQADKQLEKLGNWWLYGPGLGRTALNVGTVIVFPPYALYLLTNAGLSFAGYERLQPTKLLPEKAGSFVDSSYDELTSIPGKLTSTVAGVPFQADLNLALSSKKPQ